jgi:hypothetical protein
MDQRALDGSSAVKYSTNVVRASASEMTCASRSFSIHQQPHASQRQRCAWFAMPVHRYLQRDPCARDLPEYTSSRQVEHPWVFQLSIVWACCAPPGSPCLMHLPRNEGRKMHAPRLEHFNDFVLIALPIVSRGMHLHLARKLLEVATESVI